MAVYCNKCQSRKPMVKAGIQRYATADRKIVEKQRFECVNCHAVSVVPLRNK